jgi:hypothetical protein
MRMIIDRLVIILALLLWPVGAGAQAPAEKTAPDAEKSAPGAEKPTGNERYTLRFCNDSSRQTAYGAVAVYDSPSDDHLTVHAWYKVEKGACANAVTRRFGNYASHSVYVHGQSGGFVWPDTKKADLKLCVDKSRPYERLNSKDYNCKGKETLAGFRKIKIERVIADDAVFTYRLK